MAFEGSSTTKGQGGSKLEIEVHYPESQQQRMKKLLVEWGQHMDNLRTEVLAQQIQIEIMFRLNDDQAQLTTRMTIRKRRIYSESDQRMKKRRVEWSQRMDKLRTEVHAQKI